VEAPSRNENALKLEHVRQVREAARTVSEILRCRAQVVDACKDGELSSTVGFDYRMGEDGTWDGRSVVCDPCFVALMPLTPSGLSLNEELPFAIAVARDIRRPLHERAERFTREAIEAGLTPTAVPQADGTWKCEVYRRDGALIDRVILAEGEPPRFQREETDG
jgi:hypothetical protein